MIRSLWMKMNCPHRQGRVMAISYGGVTTVKCAGCGTLFDIQLTETRIKPGILYRARNLFSQENQGGEE